MSDNRSSSRSGDASDGTRERSASPAVQVAGVWKSFDNGRVPVLEGADVTVAPGEMVALWGPSGSGKSTLLHLVGGLDRPDRGEVRVLGRSVDGEADRVRLRRHHLGFVFQLHNLIPDLTVAENCAVPALAVGRPPAETAARIEELTAAVGIAHRRAHRVQDLSGGERQRVAICRALMNRPEVLLADEPTGSLDEETATKVFALFRDLVRREGAALLLATHERRFAEACDRILRVSHGRVLPL
ncbi:MAG TPA: ABC transporter ATP-binding protein [Opitutaceae bacterium]|nr:ABC transporter ATP-binding protein [Opitutaceae bacterium]